MPGISPWLSVHRTKVRKDYVLSKIDYLDIK